MKQAINREIATYVVQIVVILIFLVASYFLLTESRLASFNETAAQNSDRVVNLQKKYDQDREAVYKDETLIDKGTLSIKNPNKVSVVANVVLKLSKGAIENDMNIYVNGNEYSLDDAIAVGDYYEIVVENYKMNAYEDKTYDTEFKGDYTSAFNYMYDVTQNF